MRRKYTEKIHAGRLLEIMIMLTANALVGILVSMKL